jgi:Asp-tRNA(Asn)/Glu-tRNA(Gln) amidotransferase A subunit family amidase
MAAECATVHERRFRAQPDAYPPNIRGLIESGLATPAPEYLRALEAGSIYRAGMQALFLEADFLLSPGAPGPAPEGLESTGPPVFQVPWTLADLPTLSLPLDLDPGGLPLGIQLTGPPGDERGLIAAGCWLESLMAFRPPGIPDGQVA